MRAALDPAVAAKVRSGAELLRHLSNQERERSDLIPTTLDAIDTLLGGGLQRGKLVELVSRRAAGRFSIVLSALAAATTMGEVAALVDLGDHFDPQLAEANGVDLRRLLWVRPRTVKEAVMSAEMITATGFQLVVVDVGLHPLRGRRAPDAAWVRLARTAQAHGAAMLVSSPYPLTGTASEAVLKAAFSKTRWIGQGCSPRLLQSVEMNLTLEKHRHLKPGTQSTQKFPMEESLTHAPVMPTGVVKSSSRRVVEGITAQSSAGRELVSSKSGEPEKLNTRRPDDSTTRRLGPAPGPADRQPPTGNRRADGAA